MRALQLLALAGTTPNAPTSPPPPPPPPPGAPSAPTDLALTSRTATSVTFSYTDNSSNEDGFRIYASGTLAGTAAANATTITATGLTEGTEYNFVCRAFNSTDESSDSNTVTAFTKLATPTNFQAQDLGDFIRFSWNDESTKETENVLLRDGVDFVTLGESIARTDVDQTDADGFTFKVQARASGIPSSDFSGTQTGPPWPT